MADLLDTKSAEDMFPVAQIISVLNKGFIWRMERGDDDSSIANEFAENIIQGPQKFMRNR